jgi:acyl carrier protein
MSNTAQSISYNDLLLRIKEALVEVTRRPDIAELPDQAALVDDVGLDSMSVLAFFMALEERIEGFRIEVDAVETSDLETIESVASFVHKRLA